MHFVKMQGAGNDFIVLDARKGDRDWPKLARAMCDRHFGVGGDGILLVAPSQKADFKMRIINQDGSEAEMSGNGMRCFVKYVIDEGLAQAKDGELRIETLAGILHVKAMLAGGKVARVRVAMGKPRLQPTEIPVSAPGQGPILDYHLHVDGQELKVSCVSMGNPHAVAFLSDPVDQWPLETLGPQVERHPFFPRRVNFEIVNVIDRGHLKSRVWERGAGITLACGTGACATAVAARLKGLIDDSVEIAEPGGVVKVEWDGQGEVFLEGPAALTFRGEWPGA